MPAVPGEAAVILEAYNPAWPGLFDVERLALSRVLSPWLAGPIEHIGSTAVPGLSAKPVIDIMAPVGSLPGSRDALPALSPLGYSYFPYRADVMHWLCKPSAASRTHHLHLVPYESRLWHERLAFRNYLRAHPQAAEDYSRLKHTLAARYAHDREAYTEAKGPFIERVLSGDTFPP